MRGLKQLDKRQTRCYSVAPHTGAWIETDNGLSLYFAVEVAPHTGAWIETRLLPYLGCLHQVAPHTGAWIETAQRRLIRIRISSHPTRVRGLKLQARHDTYLKSVAPHTGAWIETVSVALTSAIELRRTPHGCVD